MLAWMVLEDLPRPSMDSKYFDLVDVLLRPRVAGSIVIFAESILHFTMKQYKKLLMCELCVITGKHVCFVLTLSKN